MRAGRTRWKIGNERRATKIARGLRIKLTASDHVLEPTATVPHRRQLGAPRLRDDTTTRRQGATALEFNTASSNYHFNLGPSKIISNP